MRQNTDGGRARARPSFSTHLIRQDERIKFNRQLANQRELLAAKDLVCVMFMARKRKWMAGRKRKKKKNKGSDARRCPTDAATAATHLAGRVVRRVDENRLCLGRKGRAQLVLQGHKNT